MRKKQPSDGEPVETAIYDGRNLLGHIRTCRGGFNAFDIEDTPVGKFNTARSATDALLKRHREAVLS